MFVADRCGINTNMSNDKLSNGNKRAHTKGWNVTIPGCTSNTHFTTMGITALTGKPVCAVVIIQKTTSLNFLERFGFDMEVECKGDLSVFDTVKAAAEEIKNHNKNISPEEKKRKLTMNDYCFEPPLDVLEENMGKGNVFPGGPTCEYNGKQIPAFVTNSKSSGITP